MENNVKTSLLVFESKLKYYIIQKKEEPDLMGIAIVKSALKELLEELDSLSEELQKEYGVKISKMIYENGVKSYNESDFFRLHAMLNCAVIVCNKFPDVEDMAIVYLELIKGMLELKAQMGENENLEQYQEEIETVSNNFPTNARIGLESMMCFANLQGNCSMARHNRSVFPVSVYFIEKVVDNMEAISSRFPKDERINQVYCHSLTATASELYGHKNQAIYRKFVGLLKNLVSTRKFNVAEDIMDFLRQA